MIKEYKPFVQETLGDALSLVRERFPESAVDIVRQALQNPCLKDGGSSGAIGYKNGVPVAFQMEMPRLLYCGQIKMNGLVGGMTCKTLKGCPLSVLLETLEKSYGIATIDTVFFGNSCCKATEQIDELGGSMVGPESCTRFLWRAVRPLECAAYFVRRKMFKARLPSWKEFSTLSSAEYEVKRGEIVVRRLMVVKPEFFGVLMAEYLKTNEGLVCSRTAEEVEWIFGERIKNGQCVLLGAFKEGNPIGYIILRTNETAKRWSIHDWFAIKNDEKVLDLLLCETCAYITKATPAMMLEVCGFPTWAQRLLKRYLPFERPIGHNVFSWGSNDKSFREAVLPIIDSRKSWFFGPYDGDICM